MWPLECTKSFSEIWPSKLVLDLKWPIYKPFWDIIERNILTCVISLRRKMWPLVLDLSKIWPSGIVFVLTWPTYRFEISIRQTFWSSSMSIELKMWPTQCKRLKTDNAPHTRYSIVPITFAAKEVSNGRPVKVDMHHLWFSKRLWHKAAAWIKHCTIKVYLWIWSFSYQPIFKLVSPRQG